MAGYVKVHLTRGATFHTDKYVYCILASCALAYHILDVAVNPVPVRACTCAQVGFSRSAASRPNTPTSSAMLIVPGHNSRMLSILSCLGMDSTSTFM